MQIQNEIPKSKLHDKYNTSTIIPDRFNTSTISSDEFNSCVAIPAYPTVDIDFADIKDSINQKMIDFIAESSILTRSEVTNFLTQTVCDIGYNLGYEIEKEPRYHITDLVDKDRLDGAIGDVVWKKDSVRIVMWEIDSTNKARSVMKLMSSPAKYSVWLSWAKKVSRFHINCLLHRQDCQIIRPDHNMISDYGQR